MKAVRSLANKEKSETWIGGKKGKNNSDWNWLDGSKMDLKVGWGSKLPKSSRPNKCSVVKQVGFADLTCTIKTKFICETRGLSSELDPKL